MKYFNWNEMRKIDNNNKNNLTLILLTILLILFGEEMKGIEGFVYNETIELKIESNARMNMIGRNFYLEHHYSLFHFGFEEEGRIVELNINPIYQSKEKSMNPHQEKDYFFLSICSKEEYYNVFQRYYSIDYCSNNSRSLWKEREDGEPLEWIGDAKVHLSCSIFPFNSSGLHVKDMLISSRSTFYFVLSNCPLHSQKFHIGAELRNRNGEQLSTQYIPLPPFYLYLLPVWIILSLAFTFNAIQFWKRSVPLHKLIWSIPVTKALHCGFHAYYWNHLSRWGEISMLNSFIYYSISFISETLLYSTIFLISKGWGLTRSSLSLTEIKSLCICVGSLSLASLLYQRNGGYFLFSLVIMYVISLKYVFAGLDNNFRSLLSQEQFLIQRANAQRS